MSRRKLIVVSNRGPIGYTRDDGGKLLARRGAGGLVTALAPLVSHHDVTWIASAISPADRDVAAQGVREEVATDRSRYRLRLVAHPRASYDLYYNVVANPILWFLQHGLWKNLLRPESDIGCAWDEGYVAVNGRFAEAVVEELEREPEAAVFFHDYHLYLAPRIVRERKPHAAIAHFTHIPWVGADAWSALPRPIVQAIHQGLLAADVVGFHTERWRQAFLSACADLELDTTGVLVTAHPISIDPDGFGSLARSDAVLAAERELLDSRPESLILRVDRTDPSKNVVRGLEAFSLLLERRPDLRGRVGMLALLDPSRQEIPEYVEELERITAAAAPIEARFPGSLVLEIEDDFPRSVAAYKQFDVLLVNSVMDGLNLVAKEAPLVNTRDGVVVLSENTGAHEEIGQWTIPVDPFDVGQTAAALEQALALPAEERRARVDALRSHVRVHDLRAWIGAQLADLDRATTMLRR
ncbi:MAG: trehalose-6-phosphate synthase [Actinobacteria bacterium]|nr:trehalose-6-phosphate synthase [Actinomycetota bacterium]